MTRGFSLIELSIVVAILSVVAALGLEAAANFVNRTSTSVSKERLQVVDEAVAKFFKIYGRLPCPEPRGTAPGVANWGLETCALSQVQMNNTATLAGGGLYYGGVPWRTLNLPMMYSLDGFGSKLTYVVTANLTQAGGSSTVANRFASLGGALTPVQQGIGGIEVRTGILEQPCNFASTKCQVVADPSAGTGAAYFIFSSGADQRGAVSARGSALATCTSSGANSDRRVDANNCVFGTSATRTNVSAFNGTTNVTSTIPYNVLYDNRYNPGLNLTSYYDDVAIWRPKSQL